ncbi:MAG: YnbE family lipoprotein [Pseudomonadota bacterium]
MIGVKLTKARATASCELAIEKGALMAWSARMVLAGVVLAGAVSVSGCINVAAPEEPIVIELNINIRQEVIYRLAEDAAETIDEYADIY